MVDSGRDRRRIYLSMLRPASRRSAAGCGQPGARRTTTRIDEPPVGPLDLRSVAPAVHRPRCVSCGQVLPVVGEHAGGAGAARRCPTGSSEGCGCARAPPGERKSRSGWSESISLRIGRLRKTARRSFSTRTKRPGRVGEDAARRARAAARSGTSKAVAQLLPLRSDQPCPGGRDGDHAEEVASASRPRLAWPQSTRAPPRDWPEQDAWLLDDLPGRTGPRSGRNPPDSSGPARRASLEKPTPGKSMA